MTSTLSSIINFSRFLIPDRKTKVEFISDEIGFSSVSTGVKEVFYLNYNSVGTVTIKVGPYIFTSTATFNGLSSSTSMKFLFQGTIKKVTFGTGTGSNMAMKPLRHKPVVAEYTYTKSREYHFSNEELAALIPIVNESFKELYDPGIIVSGTSPNFTLSSYTDDTKTLFALGIAVKAQAIILSELQSYGFGISFRGAMVDIDSKTQLIDLRKSHESLKNELSYYLSNKKFSNIGYSVDLYSENVVSS